MDVGLLENPLMGYSTTVLYFARKYMAGYLSAHGYRNDRRFRYHAADPKSLIKGVRCLERSEISPGLLISRQTRSTEHEKAYMQ